MTTAPQGEATKEDPSFFEFRQSALDESNRVAESLSGEPEIAALKAELAMLRELVGGQQSADNAALVEALTKIEQVADREDYYISPAAGEMARIANAALALVATAKR